MRYRTRLSWSTVALALLVIAPSVVFAQAATLTGKVTAPDGTPLYGAAVSIDAMNLQVGTNQQGQYTLTVPAARVSGQVATFRARAIGYSPEVKQVTLRPGPQTFDFVLKEDVNRLNQVVVTGVTAGTEQRKLPFTVAVVNSADLPVPGTNVVTGLVGKVPGAQVVQSFGRPGSTPSVILRAPKSLSNTNSPLYIIDGVIQQGGVADFNPDDVDNIEIVKGAAASTLYGSRAANGVIQITTKSGKNQGEGIRFTARSESGMSDIEGRYQPAPTSFLTMDETRTRYCVARGSNFNAQRETQDCLNTMDLYAEQLRINEDAGDITLSPRVFLTDGGIGLTPTKTNLRGLFQVNRWPTTFDPVSQVVTNGPFTVTTLDMQGKFGQSNFFSSVGDRRERGSVVFVDGYHRNNVRLNVDNTLGGNWTMSMRTYYARTRQFTGGADFFSVTRQPPFVDLLKRDKFGRLLFRTVVTAQGGQNTNPAYSWERANGVNEGDRFVGSAQINWQPLSWVSGTFDMGYDRSDDQSRSQSDRGARATSSPSTAALGSISRSAGWGSSYNISMNWTARRDLLSNLAGRLTLRTLYEQQDNNSDSQSGSNLAVPGVTTTEAAVTSYNLGSSESTQRSVGLIGSLNLDLMDRYIFETSARRDGLSVFGAANRWQTYGRVSVAWRLSEEKFYPLGNSVNDLKLRYSVGQAGNRPGASSQYETFNLSNGAISPQQLGNKDLRPEVATEVEIGFDAELWHKYGLSITRSKTVTEDQILSVTPPAASGFTSQIRNAGTLEGNTWEASLRIPILERRDFNWSTQLTYDQVSSKITALDVPPYYGECTGCYIAVGETFGRIWGRQMVKSCEALPEAYRSRCGEGKEWQRNDEGLIVWVGQGNSWRDGITRNLWQAVLPASQAPWGAEQSWGMPIVWRDDASTNNPQDRMLGINGHALPDFRWSMGHNFNFKKIAAYVLFDAVKGKTVYNEQRHWSLGDFAYIQEDQSGKDVSTAKPIGYYWRGGPPEFAGVGGLYEQLGPSNITVEDASYVKIREVSIGYRFGKVLGVGDWTVSVVGRNLKTFTNYTGWDPEVGSVLSAVDASGGGFPTRRIVTLTLVSSF